MAFKRSNRQCSCRAMHLVSESWKDGRLLGAHGCCRSLHMQLKHRGTCLLVARQLLVHTGTTALQGLRPVYVELSYRGVQEEMTS